MKKIFLIFLMFFLCTSLFATEAIIFNDGKSIIAMKHEFAGGSIILTTEGGSTILFDQSLVKGIREIKAMDENQKAASEPSPQSPDCNKIIEEVAEKHRVDSTLVKAIVSVESNFNPKAISPKGAQGLMQLMPQTAARFEVNDVFNPEDNIEGGIRYLKFLTDKYGDRFDLILAAYNAGEEAVSKYGGIPPYGETIHYVLKVLKLYNKN